ncbi:MAG: hypothetical protein M3024_10675 [Candidatus Dormibacteraeota bacterium]|nr:hypothetical protein [Candidatus Dormibacteraeota bacterium]
MTPPPGLPTEVEAIARTVLYEGYLLYPYARSAAKNQVRFTFGGVYPPAWTADPCRMQSECLLQAGPGCRLDVTVRCLQLVRRREPDEPDWQEAVERTVVAITTTPERLEHRSRRLHVDLAAGRSEEASVQREWSRIQATVTLCATPLGDDAHRVTVLIQNTTPAPPGLERDEALLRALVSTHIVLHVEGGRLLSLADPPPELREAAAACVNQGVWPVPVGEPGSQSTVLCSPIILEDYPQLAPESPGDLFDGTEVDELLTLSILSLTDEEKAEMRRSDERGRELLERTEALTADQMLRLHAAMRPMGAIREPPQ